MLLRPLSAFFHRSLEDAIEFLRRNDEARAELVVALLDVPSATVPRQQVIELAKDLPVVVVSVRWATAS